MNSTAECIVIFQALKKIRNFNGLPVSIHGPILNVCLFSIYVCLIVVKAVGFCRFALEPSSWVKFSVNCVFENRLNRELNSDL